MIVVYKYNGCCNTNTQLLCWLKYCSSLLSNTVFRNVTAAVSPINTVHVSEMFVLLWFGCSQCCRNVNTVYPKKYAHCFVVLCFVVVMQSVIMNSHEVFIHIHQGCFAGTGAIVRLPQCQWSKPDGYGKISQCITTTKHSKAKTVCIFLGIYCIFQYMTWIYGMLITRPLRNKTQ